MRTAEEVLEKYRKAGFIERLNFYLEYRDLRDQFTDIDSEERASTKRAVSEKKARRTLTGSMRYRIAKCLSPRW